MLFVLRKLAESMLLPIGLAVILTFTGIVGRRRWISAMGGLILYIFSIPITANRLLRSLESGWPAQTIASVPRADAIVVLSGSVIRGINASGVQWGESANRYFAGFALEEAGKANLLVFSAAASDDPAGPTQGAAEKEVAAQHGVAPDRLVVTRPVQTTEDEAREVARVRSIHSVLLVTSAFHMSRAALLFRAQGLTVYPFPTDVRGFGTPRAMFSRWIPSAGPLHASEMALREYYGLAVYHVLLWRK
jgi:uncharacterized SAM-binding protein YcdF (DUF218 family)